MRTLLRRPDFRLLAAGVLAGLFAESIMLLALAIWVKDLTGSNAMAGATLFAIVAPMATAPVVGWVVDRFPRRTLFVRANLATALVLLPLLAVRDRHDVWIIFTVAVLYGCSHLARSAALHGLIKDLVPGDLLAEANATLQTVRQGMRLIGPLAGAALYAGIGGWTLAVTGAFGFMVAAGAVGLLRVREGQPGTGRRRWLTEAGAGGRHLLGDPGLRRALIGSGLAVLLMGFSDSLIFAYVDQGLHRRPEFVGILVTVQGIGGLLGAVCSPLLVNRLGELATLAAGVTSFAVGAMLLAFPDVRLAFVALVCLGLSLPFLTVGMSTLSQQRTPGPLLGRVSAVRDALVSAPQSLSIGLGALLVGVLDYRLLFALTGLALLIPAGYLWSGRRLSPPASRPSGRSRSTAATVPAPRRAVDESGRVPDVTR
jgi:MFS family permease